MNKILTVAMVLIIFFLTWSCEIFTDPGLENPFDTTASEFIPPRTKIISGPDEQQTVNTHTVTFAWQGNETSAEYSFSLDSLEWSKWSVDTTATFSLLDEGSHMFQVKSRSPAEIEEDTASVRSFIVDAVQGPALMFFPRRVGVGTNNSFTLEIMAEEVSGLAGLSFEVPYNDPAIDFLDYDVFESSSAFLAKDNATVLTIVENDETDEVLKVALGRAGGTTSGVDGTGTLMNITFQFTGSSGIQINLQNCEMQNPQMQDITINEVVECVIEVE